MEKTLSMDNIVVAEDKEAGLIIGLKNEKFVIYAYRGLEIARNI